MIYIGVLVLYNMYMATHLWTFSIPRISVLCSHFRRVFQYWVFQYLVHTSVPGFMFPLFPYGVGTYFLGISVYGVVTFVPGNFYSAYFCIRGRYFSLLCTLFSVYIYGTCNEYVQCTYINNWTGDV
jgi:hypothetical protein